MYETECSLVFSGKKNLFNNNAFNIVGAEGEEGVSKLYRFDITIAVEISGSKSQWDDIKKMLNEPATLLLKHRQERDSKEQMLNWHGVITSLAQDGRDSDYCYYKIVLEPSMAKLRWLFCSDVYLDKQLDDIIKDVMNSSEFKNFKQGSKKDIQPSDAFDYVIDTEGKDKFSQLLTKSHQQFTCQFEESYLDFIQRRAEFYGVHYTFTQLDEKACMVFSYELKVPEKDSSEFLKAQYNPIYSSEVTHDAIAITDLRKGLAVHANQMYLQRSPSYFNATEEKLSSASRELSEHHAEIGVYSSRDQFERLEDSQNNSPVENRSISGEYLAKIRSAVIQSEQSEVKGTAVSPGIVSGRYIHIDEQLESTANSSGDDQRKDDYFVLSVKHRWGALDKSQWKQEKASLQSYQADFVLLPCFDDKNESSPFYPKQTTQVPRIESMVSGFIDGVPYKTQENCGAPNLIDTTYPKMDNYGRYKVRFAFAKQLKASYENNSAWVRLATPFAGGDSARTFDNNGVASNKSNSGGLHFPLRAGTEVLISFINGDPDYPVIVSAMTNEVAPSPVASGAKDSNGTTIRHYNGNQFCFQTPVGNRMTVTDVANDQQDGGSQDSSKSSWTFYTPADSSQLKLGEYQYTNINDNVINTSGFHLSTKGTGVVEAKEGLFLASPSGVKIVSGETSRIDALVEKIVGKKEYTKTPAGTGKLPEEGSEGQDDQDLNKSDNTVSFISGENTASLVNAENTASVVNGENTASVVNEEVEASVFEVESYNSLFHIYSVIAAILHVEISAAPFKLEIVADHKVGALNFSKHDHIQLYERKHASVAKHDEVHADVSTQALTRSDITKRRESISVTVSDKAADMNSEYLTFKKTAKKGTHKIDVLTCEYKTYSCATTLSYKVAVNKNSIFRMNAAGVDIISKPAKLSVTEAGIAASGPVVSLAGESIDLDADTINHTGALVRIG